MKNMSNNRKMVGLCKQCKKEVAGDCEKGLCEECCRSNRYRQHLQCCEGGYGSSSEARVLTLYFLTSTFTCVLRGRRTGGREPGTQSLAQDGTAAKVGSLSPIAVHIDSG